ncbi:MAG: hypothetical protein EOL97_16670 [Spirochaetia bacterium]|nr:hypothetical protein [Spirochaetia bacterium]
MSVLLIILFPMPEYRDYVMFGLLVFVVSINRWESDKILKQIKANTSHDSKVLNIPRVSNCKNYDRKDVINIIYSVLQATGKDIKLTWKGTYAEFDGKDIDKWIDGNL